MAKVRSPLLAALLGGESAPEITQKPKKAPQKAALQSAPTLPMYEEPSPQERTRRHMNDAKVQATRDWVEGRISTAKHKTIHSRANAVLKNKGKRP